jgi:DNA-binding GntR family transcriptional regulator
MTPEDLEELGACRAALRQDLEGTRAREPGEERRSIMGDWVRANHAFHDVIYRVADLPLVEQLAKSSRRSFSGPAVWAPGDHSIDGLYAKNAEQHRAIRPGARRRQRRGSAGARARARHFLVRAPRGDPRAGRRHLAAAEALRR